LNNIRENCHFTYEFVALIDLLVVFNLGGLERVDVVASCVIEHVMHILLRRHLALDHVVADGDLVSLKRCH
jgi:hypothetical protein